MQSNGKMLLVHYCESDKIHVFLGLIVIYAIKWRNVISGLLCIRYDTRCI